MRQQAAERAASEAMRLEALAKTAEEAARRAARQVDAAWVKVVKAKGEAKVAARAEWNRLRAAAAEAKEAAAAAGASARAALLFSEAALVRSLSASGMTPSEIAARDAAKAANAAKHLAIERARVEGFQNGGSNRLVFLSFYIAFLFVLLTPGILFRFPKGCKKLTVAATHGLLLVVIYYFTSGILLDALSI
jgi:hypothetical protein